MGDAWSAMDADEKKTFDDKALELKKKHGEDLAEYRNSQGYKNYMRVFNAVNGTAARAKNARAKAKAVAAKSRGKPAKTSVEAKATVTVTKWEVKVTATPIEQPLSWLTL